MPEPREPEQLDYFSRPEPVRSSATRKAVGLAGFIGFATVAVLFCAPFVPIIFNGEVAVIPLIILVGLVAGFLIFLAVREFRDFLR